MTFVFVAPIELISVVPVAAPEQEAPPRYPSEVWIEKVSVRLKPSPIILVVDVLKHLDLPNAVRSRVGYLGVSSRPFCQTPPGRKRVGVGAFQKTDVIISGEVCRAAAFSPGKLGYHKVEYLAVEPRDGGRFNRNAVYIEWNLRRRIVNVLQLFRRGVLCAPARFRQGS